MKISMDCYNILIYQYEGFKMKQIYFKKTYSLETYLRILRFATYHPEQL